MNTRWRLDETKVLIYASYLIVILVFWGPVVWMVSLSLKTVGEILAYPPKLFPSGFVIENYGYIFTQSTIPRNMLNSAKITVITVIGTLLVTVPASYGFSRFRFKGRTQILMAILLFQMISTLIIILPLYRYFIKLNLLDSHLGLILIYITVQIPFTVWLLKGFFDSIPKSLDDAARIDGASRLQSVIRVLIPVAMPGIAAAVLFNTINAWSQFLIPVHIHRQGPPPTGLGRGRQVRRDGGRSDRHHAPAGRGEPDGDASRHRHIHRPATVYRQNPDLRRGEGVEHRRRRHLG